MLLSASTRRASSGVNVWGGRRDPPRPAPENQRDDTVCVGVAMHAVISRPGHPVTRQDTVHVQCDQSPNLEGRGIGPYSVI